MYLLVRFDSARARRPPAPKRCKQPTKVGTGTRPQMPSLVRFLSVIAVVAAVIYAGVYALSHFVQPKPREITVSIPPEKFFKNR
jgi:hypothetical protein